MTLRCCLVVAMASNRVIGRDGGMPWHIPADLRHFRAVTMGRPIVMGRKTFQSIGRPLPGRSNIVVTRDQGFSVPGVTVFGNVDDALQAAESTARRDGVDEIMVIGGGEIYARLLPAASRIYLTEVHEAPDGDVVFPEINAAVWRETARDDFAADGETPAYSFVTLDRA
ncbi:MAG: dihydrofolate reductase [Proteobacteria bacterium]|nr:dihydrofolate reductase [Pseudomonadota bacterium]